MFSVGSKVVHPTCGAGTIVQIQSKSLGDETCEYYVIETASKGRRLFVPVDRGEAVGLHPVASEERLERILDEPFTEPKPGDIDCDYKSRQEIMREQLKSGSFGQVYHVVRTLYYISHQRPLGTVDRGLLDLGKELLASEYALAAGVELDDGLRRVEDCLATIEVSD